MTVGEELSEVPKALIKVFALRVRVEFTQTNVAKNFPWGG